MTVQASETGLLHEASSNRLEDFYLTKFYTKQLLKEEECAAYIKSCILHIISRPLENIPKIIGLH